VCVCVCVCVVHTRLHMSAPVDERRDRNTQAQHTRWPARAHICASGCVWRCPTTCLALGLSAILPPSTNPLSFFSYLDSSCLVRFLPVFQAQVAK
jgi:hypothetical protein